MDIIAPRADFKGAVYQLLIGLLQSTCAPENAREWQHRWQNPPDEATLQAAFGPVAHLFDVFPDSGPAFMQDVHLDGGAEVPIENLLIDASESHFNKPGRVPCMAPHWAAVALFTLQINAPAGGRGHRVSLRGGGPLTTLVLPPVQSAFSSLWHTLWLNVLTTDEFARRHGNHALDGLADTYPWAGPTRTSEAGLETFAEDINPLQMYWSMPRRIRLHPPQAVSTVCAVSGERISEGVTAFTAKSYGTSYAGQWDHPLTPYVEPEGAERLSRKGQPGGIGYRHWLGTVLGESDGKQRSVPAVVTSAWLANRRSWISRAERLDAAPALSPRLWAFGYDMDNMKARAWYASILPLLGPTGVDLDTVVAEVRDLVKGAQQARKALVSSVKLVWKVDTKKNKGDTSAIDANFWDRTEPAFYSALERILAGDRRPARQAWRRHVRAAAEQLFDHYTAHDCQSGGKGFRGVMRARDGKGGLHHQLNKGALLKIDKPQGERS